MYHVEASNKGAIIGERPVTPPGSESVACGKRDDRNLGDPCRSRGGWKIRPVAGRDSQPNGGRPKAVRESDHFIVL